MRATQPYGSTLHGGNQCHREKETLKGTIDDLYEREKGDNVEMTVDSKMEEEYALL